MKTQLPQATSSSTSEFMVKRSRKTRSVFWKIRSDIPKRLYYMMITVSMLVPLLGWSVLTYGGFVEPLFLPTPTAVIQQFFNLLQSGDLIHDIGMSVSRVGT